MDLSVPERLDALCVGRFINAAKDVIVDYFIYHPWYLI